MKSFNSDCKLLQVFMQRSVLHFMPACFQDYRVQTLKDSRSRYLLLEHRAGRNSNQAGRRRSHLLPASGWRCGLRGCAQQAPLRAGAPVLLGPRASGGPWRQAGRPGPGLVAAGAPQQVGRPGAALQGPLSSREFKCPLHVFVSTLSFVPFLPLFSYVSPRRI